MDATELSRELLGRDVQDAARRHIGRIESLYRDQDDSSVCFARITITRHGRRRLVFAPLIDATTSRAAVTVRCGAQLARSAPRIRSTQEPLAEVEAALYAYYELTYHPLPDGSARLRRVH